MSMQVSRKSKARKTLRKKLLAEQNYQCFYCGCRLHHKTATIDHFFPASLGYHITDNAVLACLECNATKEARLPTLCETFRAEVLYEVNGRCLSPRQTKENIFYELFKRVKGLETFKPREFYS